MRHLALLAIVWIGGPILAFYNVYAGVAFLIVCMVVIDWKSLSSKVVRRRNSRGSGASS